MFRGQIIKTLRRVQGFEHEVEKFARVDVAFEARRMIVSERVRVVHASSARRNVHQSSREHVKTTDFM